jgi:hypothetical protein
MKKEIIVLESVGAVLTNGFVYPQYESGQYDKANGVLLINCDLEWFDFLSNEEFTIVQEYKIETNKNIQKK